MENELFDFISNYMPLSQEEKKAIRDSAIFRSYKKGAVLLKEGDLSKNSYFVIKGCLRSYYVVDGEEKTTTFYTEFDSYVPQSIVTNKPSGQYVSCVEDCILTVGTPDTENTMLEKFPRFETLCRIISDELLVKNQVSFDNFKTSSPEQRYLQLLKDRPDLLQRVPQHQLASYLGITPQSLSRLRKRIINKVHS